MLVGITLHFLGNVFLQVMQLERIGTILVVFSGILMFIVRPLLERKKRKAQAVDHPIPTPPDDNKDDDFPPTHMDTNVQMRCRR